MPPSSSAAKPRPPSIWFVQASGRVWGPYLAARLEDFVREGRVGARTLVARQAGGPFGPAASIAELQALFGPRSVVVPPAPVGTAPAAAPRPAPQPQPQPTVEAAVRTEPASSQEGEPAERSQPVAAPAPSPAPPSPAPGPAPTQAREAGARSPSARALVIWADLASVTVAQFEAALADHGQIAGIRPGLWLIQAKMGPAALRNLLSRRLNSEDALLVLEAPLDQAAWFNLDQAAERNLRHLWSGAGQG